MKILIKNISQIVSSSKCDYAPLGKTEKEPIVEGNSILIENGKIKNIDYDISDASADRIIDAGFNVITPGFVDNHTHLVFAGTREEEFYKRLKGYSYKRIAEEGGGILNTVLKTRKADFDSLYENSLKWLNRMIENGITSIEIKSGYGLELKTEIKQLEVIKKLKENFDINIKATFLGAHEIPTEYRSRRDDYIKMLIEDMIPQIAEKGLADYIDVFCEKGVYTPEETENILKAGEKYGLKGRIHADEINESGGSDIAAKMKILSVDHMNAPSIESLNELALNKTVITLLPATNFILSIDKNPPIDIMRKNGNIIAVSTDFNPGSSPVLSIQLSAEMGMYKYKLLMDELIYAITINPAYSLEISDRTGSIEIGKDADLLVHSVDNYKKLFYYFGYNTVKCVLSKGRVLYERI